MVELANVYVERMAAIIHEKLTKVSVRFAEWQIATVWTVINRLTDRGMSTVGGSPRRTVN